MIILNLPLSALFGNGSAGHFEENGSTKSGHENDFFIGSAPTGFGDLPIGSAEDCALPTATPTNTPTETPTSTFTPTATFTVTSTLTPTSTATPELVDICHVTQRADGGLDRILITGLNKANNEHLDENGDPKGSTHSLDFYWPGIAQNQNVGNCESDPTPTPTITSTPSSETPTPQPTPPSLTFEPSNLICVEYIIFHTFRDGNLEIYRLDGVEGSDDFTLYNLSKGPNSEDSRPSRSWNDQLVVFESNRDGNVELYLTDTIGSFQTRVTFTTANNVNPMFLPDNETVVFQSDRNGNWDIFSVNINTGVETQLTTDPADDVFPYASPDENWITFQSNRSGNENIYLLNLETGDEFQVTSGNENEIYPAWSPNADYPYLGYLTDVNGEWDLMIYNLETQETINLTPELGEDADNHSWAPIGSRIAYQSMRDGNLDIYTYDLLTDEEYRVSEVTDVDSSPTWDCGSSNVAFTSTRDGDANIFSAPWQGGGNGNLTIHPSTDKWSEWSPSKEQGSRGR